MKYEYAKKLCDTFPIIYRKPDVIGPGHWRATKGNYDLPFYFECQSGWLDLILECSEHLEKVASLISPEKDRPLVVQVKEKFGGLRFYYHHIPIEYKAIRSLINVNERRSYSICEFCGRDGKIRQTGWAKTMCDECHLMWNETDRFKHLYEKYT